MTAQTHTTHPTPNRGPGHVIHRLERRLAGGDGVPTHFGLNDGLDDAADEDDPERGIADLRTERGGGDELTGAHDRGGEHQARPDAAEDGAEGSRRIGDVARPKLVGISGRRRLGGTA